VHPALAMANRKCIGKQQHHRWTNGQSCHHSPHPMATRRTRMMCASGTTFDSIPFADKVVWLAPDSLHFELKLNGKNIVTQFLYNLWPMSFSSEDIIIYPNNWNVRPYVIDAQVFRSFLKEEGNELLLSTTNASTGKWSMNDCVLLLSTNNNDEKTHQLPVGVRFEPSGLPVVQVNVKTNSILKSEKVTAQMQVLCAGVTDDDCQDEAYNVKMNVRGFSSSHFTKKQYSMQVLDETNKKLKVELLGMNEAKRWILQGPYSDPSLMRNPFAYQLWRKMGYWAPDSRYIELVLNNTYQGVYYLMERVEANSARLDIDGVTKDITPFLVQLNRVDNNDTIVRVMNHPFILYKTPRNKVTDETYRSSVEDALQLMMQEMKQPLKSSLIHWESFADYILFQELMKNVDAYVVSTYFHSDGRQIKAGPIWDFDLGIGVSARDGGKSPEGFVYDVNAGKLPGFWKDLIRNGAFQSYMKERYAQLRQTIWTEERLLKSIVAFEKQIGRDAINRNYLRFPIWGAKNLETYSQLPASYDKELEGMKQWLQTRLRWMDGQLRK
jgi:spore coat protein CotH